MRRFHTTHPLAGKTPGAIVTIEAAEAHHLLHVLRLKPGEAIELFDGSGWSVAATVGKSSRREVEALLADTPARQPDDSLQLTLALAAPKQDRLRWLVEKASELGVARIVLLNTERTVVTPGTGALAKLHEAAIQACKQCGRNDVPPIEEPQSLEAVLMAFGGGNLLAGDPQGEPLASAFGPECRVRGAWTVIIGPEGGLTESENEFVVANGARLVRWANHVLRIETAALAAAAILRGLAAD